MNDCIIEMNDGWKFGNLFLKKERGWTRELVDEIQTVVSDAASSAYEKGLECAAADSYDEGYKDALAVSEGSSL
jgi:hypothetical protein